MSGRGGREDKRIKRTVGYIMPCPRSSVLEAMQAFKFSDERVRTPGSRWWSAAHVRKATSAKRKPSLPMNRRVESWFDDRVPADHCSRRRQLDHITPIDADDARRGGR
jgi:hypothetical protein